MGACGAMYMVVGGRVVLRACGSLLLASMFIVCALQIQLFSRPILMQTTRCIRKESILCRARTDKDLTQSFIFWFVILKVPGLLRMSLEADEIHAFADTYLRMHNDHCVINKSNERLR